MIDFEQVWLPQIASYARLISTGQLEDQWLGRVGVISSVADPDELAEQLFGDLDAQNIWAENRSASDLSSAAQQAIDHFLAALEKIESGEPLRVVGSAAWEETKEAAQAVAACFR